MKLGELSPNSGICNSERGQRLNPYPRCLNHDIILAVIFQLAVTVMNVIATTVCCCYELLLHLRALFMRQDRSYLFNLIYLFFFFGVLPGLYNILSVFIICKIQEIEVLFLMLFVAIIEFLKFISKLTFLSLSKTNKIYCYFRYFCCPCFFLYLSIFDKPRLFLYIIKNRHLIVSNFA